MVTLSGSLSALVENLENVDTAGVYAHDLPSVAQAPALPDIGEHQVLDTTARHDDDGRCGVVAWECASWYREQTGALLHR